jgi:hypothetical protein
MREIFQYSEKENFNAGAIHSADKLIKKSEQNVTPRLVNRISKEIRNGANGMSDIEGKAAR